MRAARFVAMDSMNLWIDIAHDALLQTIWLVDCLVLNDSELKQLTDEPNLVRAARKALDLGPRVVIAKQGEYGSAMITRDGYFGLTAYPTAEIVEPTGAGDTFAGGVMGYLAAQGDELDDAALRRAMAYGTAAPRSTSRASAPSACTRSSAPRSTRASPSSRRSAASSACSSGGRTASRQ